MYIPPDVVIVYPHTRGHWLADKGHRDGAMPEFIADSFGPPTMPRGPGHRGEDYWRYKEDRNEPKKAMGSGCGTGTTRRRRRCRPGWRGWICRGQWGQWGRERRGEVLRGHAARDVSFRPRWCRHL